MNICFFSFGGVHPLGHRATHPVEPPAARLAVLLLPGPPEQHAFTRVRRRLPSQLAAACWAQASQRTGLRQAVQTWAGTFEVVAFALSSRVASGPLRRVQMRNPG